MPIFEKDGKKILFVHIPKTGGTSIEKWLGNFCATSLISEFPPLSLRVSPQHLQTRELKVIFGEKYWEWGFTIVRSPYDRIESEYFYRTQNMYQSRGTRPNFSTWVIEQISNAKKDPFYLDNHLRPQTDFIDSDIDVFRLEGGLETVEEKLKDIFKIDSTRPIDKKNASKREKLHWSVDTRNLVNDWYANDFEQLEYELISPKLKLFGRN